MDSRWPTFFVSFAFERVQLIGRAEWKYFNALSKDERKKIADQFMTYEIPCLIFSRGLEVLKNS